MPPQERRKPQTPLTKRQIAEIAADPNNNPYTGGLYSPRPQSTRLAEEKTLRVVTYGTSVREYEFLGQNTLRRLDKGVWYEEYYESYDAAPGIVLFFHIHKGNIPPKMTAMCIDFNTDLVTINDAKVGNYDYSPRDTSNTLTFGAVERNGTAPKERHAYTDDFVGKVAAWKVADVWLTHHYINPKFFLNEILGMGPDSVYLTIAEPAQYVKIAENIYVFTWREMAGPGIMGMDVMDWSTMKSVGFFFGINEDDRFECYCFSRHAGKWLDIEERKKIHREGIYSVVAGL